MASITQIDQKLAEFLKELDVPIIDLRCQSEYSQGHLVDSSHFELNTLIERMHELPKRDQPLKLVGTQQQISSGEQKLTEKGYQIVRCLIWRDEYQYPLQTHQLYEVGEASKRLWRAAPAIEEYVQDNPPSLPHNRALDIGCGGGRDAVYLAINGWRVTAIDYLPSMLQKASMLASRYQTKVECQRMDLEDASRPLLSLQTQFDLIIVMRYLYRPLFQQIKTQLSNNGVLIYQTFMEGCEAFGKPKNPRFILKADELKQEFKGYKIIKNETRYLGDGRPTNLFIARKPDNLRNC